MIWNSLQRAAINLGMCETPGGDYFELAFIPVFFVAIVFIDLTVFLCFAWIETLSIRKAFGFSNATPSQFLISRYMGVISLTLAFCPLIMFGDVVVINFKKNITMAFFFGTFIGKGYLLWVHPYLKLLFDKQKVEFPEDRLELRSKIVKMATALGYPDADSKIFLYTSRSGDLHSNASVNSRNINLSLELIEHHEGHDEEILAILAHELGHWKENHIYWFSAADLVYMTICGFCFQFVVDNPVLFRAFGFTQYSNFISIYLFYKVYSCSLDYPQRKLFNVLYRHCEYVADDYALRCHIEGMDEKEHHPIIMSLLRNYSVNLDALFVDKFYSQLQNSHPTLLERLKALGMPIKNQEGDKDNNA